MAKNWTPRWYYIMKNKTSNKLYTGQTTRSIDEYLGSGIYWKPHCKKYGGYSKDNIEIVDSIWCNFKSEASLWLTELEQKCPNYWLSEEWANQVPETLDENPFFNKDVQQAIKNKTDRSHLKGKSFSKETETGTEKFKYMMLKKYGVENAMQVPEIAKKSGKACSKTKKEKGSAKGINNPKARSITINGIHFSLIKDACSYFNISLPTLKKYTDGKENCTIDLNLIEKYRKQTSNALKARGKHNGTSNQ